MVKKRAKKAFGAMHDLVNTSIGIPRSIKAMADREELNLSQFVRECLKARYSKTAAERIQALNEALQAEQRALAAEQVRKALMEKLSEDVQMAAYHEWKNLGLNPTFDQERAAWSHYITVLCHLTDGLPGAYLDEAMLFVEREKLPVWEAMAANRSKVVKQ